MPSRRDLLSGSARLAAGAAVGSLFPPSIQRALSIPAAHRTGSVQDVHHVVILMMENRASTIISARSRACGASAIAIPCRWRAASRSGTSPMARAKSRPIIWIPRPPARCACPARRIAFATPRRPGTRASSASGPNSRPRFPWAITGARICRISSPWRRPSRSAMPIIAPSPPAPIPTGSCSGLAPMPIPLARAKAATATRG